jgi:hypothetical protein
MLRVLSALFLATVAVSGQSQEAAPALAGALQAGVYISPTNAFKIAVPVLQELGGRVRDTEQVVFFQDSFSVQISIGTFKQDATQRWEMETRDIKDYEIYYFSRLVMPDFKRYCPNASIESATFAPHFLDGALFCYILLPGGSMFADQLAFTPSGKPPVAKRGNLVFVRNGFVYVVSTELAEKVTEGPAYKKTPEEEDQILRKRLSDIVAKMQFTGPPPAKPAPGDAHSTP